MKKSEMQNKNWKEIHTDFTEELQQKWKEKEFKYKQVKKWANALGKDYFEVSYYDFCAWLRDNKHFTPEQVLNKGNLKQLNQEFFTYWQEQQQTQIEQPPK